MIAALVLEKRSARKSDVAYLSIARSINNGPRKVVHSLLSSKSWSVLTYVELWLICLLALVMVALQFSSTLLLSDFHNFDIIGDVKSQLVTNFGSFALSITTEAAVSVTEPTFAIFGEERSSYDMTPSASGFSDTGIIRRGHLPLQNGDNITSVRKYRGSTLVTNSRVVCVPPQIQGHVLPRDETSQQSWVAYMVGTVNYGQSIRQAHQGLGPLCAGYGCESTSFDCR
jgi:hypothetical protein